MEPQLLPSSLPTRSPRLPAKRLADVARLGIITVLGFVLIFEFFRMEDPAHPIRWGLLGVLALLLVLEYYVLAAPWLMRWSYHPVADRHEEVVLFTPGNWVYTYHRHLRLVLMALTLVLVMVTKAYLVWLNGPGSLILLLQLHIFNLILLTWFISICIHHFRMGGLTWLWMWGVIAVISGASLAAAAWVQQHDLLLSALVFLFGAGIVVTIYLMQRISVGDLVWSEVLSNINRKLLESASGQPDWQQIISLIHDRLRYERVAILVPGADRSLVIQAEVGYPQSNQGSRIPGGSGITGRAYRTRSLCAWNDVRKCDYYVTFFDPQKDPTRSEIAVPITHQDEIFGVLDVQSRYPMVYGPRTIESLKVIAQILGAAFFSLKTSELLKSTSALWNTLSKDLLSEHEIWDAIAEFAQKELGVDLVSIYRLSPTGYPTTPPLVYGTLFHDERMHTPLVDVSSPLIRLIHQWDYLFFEDVATRSIFLRDGALVPGGFIDRERIHANAFIPVGTAEDKLAVIFLNYREKRSFNDLFKLMARGFSQTIDTFLQRQRYQQFLYEGLGHPSFNIHTIIGRYGYKTGVFSRARQMLTERCSLQTSNIAECGLVDLLQEMDGFITEVRAMRARDISIWDNTLDEAINTLSGQMKEHTLHTPVRFEVHLDPQVERATAWTRLALFRFIEETVNNAIFHGQASIITIRVQRGEKSIFASVSNNGTPLPEESARNRSTHGIYSIIDQIYDAFINVEPKKGYHTITTGEDGIGTKVEIEIPALPVISREVGS